MGLYGSGVIVINPPWGLAESLREALPWLVDALKEDKGAGHSIVFEERGDRSGEESGNAPEKGIQGRNLSGSGTKPEAGRDRESAAWKESGRKGRDSFDAPEGRWGVGEGTSTRGGVSESNR